MFTTQRSETLVKISPALVRAQRNITHAKKDSANPFFKSSYADLGSVMGACKAQLNAEGIVVLQPVGMDEVGSYVETVLLHESGEWLSSKMRVMVTKNDSQSLGSGISYARRYSLQSLVFLSAEDDDGEASVGRPQSSGTVTVPMRKPGGFKPKAEVPKTETKVAPAGEAW